MEENNWQEITLDFFKELVMDYFSKKPNSYDNVVLEVSDPRGEKRLFLDRVSFKEPGGIDRYKKLFDDPDDLIVKIIDIPAFAKELSGFLVVSYKDNPILKDGRSILRDFISSGEKLILERLIEDSEKPSVYPMMEGGLTEEFLFNHMVHSVPPGEVDDSGGRNEPLWYKEKGEIPKTKEDWDLDLIEKYIKIRPITSEEFWKGL